MKSAIFLGVFCLLANAFLSNAIPLTLNEMADVLQHGAGDNRQECAKTAVRVVANEDASNIGDFHEKSDVDKIKTLHKETMRMMQNGNKGWRATGRMMQIMEEESGGEEVYRESYFGNYTDVLAKGSVNSTMICTILGNLEAFYKPAKQAIGTSVGSSDKFWPMIKDMMSSSDLEHKDIRESPAVFFAAGSIMMFGLPNEVIDMMGKAMDLVPENLLRQKIREKSINVKPFPFNQN